MPYFFFAESEKLITQEQNAFGPIDENQYRLANLFNASSSSKAFAVTAGNILVQEVVGNSSLVNLIIKPNEQPDLDLPKIAYIIYKSVLKNSIIENTGIIAASGKNDLTKKIWESHALQVAASADNPNLLPPDNPKATDILGFGYRVTGIGDDKALDSDNLNKAFYSDKRTLFPIVGGDYIGDFDLNNVGIMIVLEKPGFNSTFKLAREIDSKLTFSPLSTTATNAEKFKRKSDKEGVLCFIDSCAFFGAFNTLGIKSYIGNVFTLLSEQALYNAVTSKHLNKRKVYFDIRNEYDDSLNYYENYSNNITWCLDNSNVYTPVNYYRNGWPELIVDDIEIGPVNTTKSIKLGLPMRGKGMPTVYLKRAYRTDVGLDTLPKGAWKFPFMDVGGIHDNMINLSCDIGIPNLENHITANYFQIKCFSKIAGRAADVDSTQLIYKRYYLDNLFPVFDMEIPFNQISNKSSFKIFYDSGYTDKTLINATDYSHNIGIAKDDMFVTLISFPFNYNGNVRLNADDIIPLGGLEGASSKLFLTQVTDLVKTIKLAKGEFIINGVKKEYLRFRIDENSTVAGMVGSNYTFDDVTVFALTKQQFDDVKVIKEHEFSANYKVYLGITEVNTGVDDLGKSFTKFKYILNGIKEELGEVIQHEAIVNIEIFTDQKIIGESYKRNFEEAVGYDHYYDTVQKINYEDYFIGLSQPIKALVEGFGKSILSVNTSMPSTYAKIQSIIKKESSKLWVTAKAQVQTNVNNPDDRPLYWARIKMGVAIKSLPFFITDIFNGSEVVPGSKLEEVILLFEEGSRNYKGIKFPTSIGDKKKILITGFDPFLLNQWENAGDNVLQSNPSGCVALSLNGISTSNNLGYIQTLIVPVRYTDFDGSLDNSTGLGTGIIEKYIRELIDVVDMIVTISQAGEGDYNIDRYATVNRGGFRENLNYERTRISNSIEGGDNWIETTLPDSFIHDPVRYNYKYIDDLVQYNSSSPVYKDGSILGQEPDSSKRMYEGPGGDYLSNEIFYRVAKLRKESKPDLSTGHFHISKLQTATGQDFSGTATKDLINIVKTAINNGINGI